MSTQEKKPLFSGINRWIIILAVVSLLTDISSEMILPLLPLFLTSVLLADIVVVGLIEGVAEGTANMVKGVSGVLTDRVHRKRKLVIFGYGLSSLSKPVIAFASGWTTILGARFVDRVGKGIRTPPRDFLLSTSIDEGYRGVAFGFHRAMDTIGAIIGASIALILLIIFSNNLEIFRTVFLLSFFPAFVGVLCLFLFKEVPLEKKLELKQVNSVRLPRIYWFFLLLSITLAVVQLPPAFFILMTSTVISFSIPAWWPFTGPLSGAIFAVFGFLLYNITYAALSTKLGSLSDKFGRVPVIMFGLLLLISILFIFAIIPVLKIPEVAIASMMLLGVYIASTEGITKAFIADLTKGDLIYRRGSAYGYFHMSIGITTLISSVIFGLLWKDVGASNAFILYGVFAVIPLLGFSVLRKHLNKTTNTAN